MHLSLHGLSENEQDFLKDLPNFSIKTLIDSLPGENFSKDDFISDTIISKYYSPIEFKSKKFDEKSFSMVHLNISSLQLHIDELRTLLQILDHPFDIIAITETGLTNQETLIDVSISGYHFYHTETKTQKGGAAIYIKDSYECNVLNSYTISIENVCETLFIEIKNKKKKNLIVGCIYRHHTPIESFCKEFFKPAIQKIIKSKKMCALLGDFNINLLDYAKHNGVSNFYDLLSAFGFCPLILQPSHIRNNSTTLIHNILSINYLTFLMEETLLLLYLTI